METNHRSDWELALPNSIDEQALHSDERGQLQGVPHSTTVQRSYTRGNLTEADKHTQECTCLPVRELCRPHKFLLR